MVPEITISTGQKVLNFCANNYLGLSSHPEVIQAAKDAMDSHGFGMSSVRFICGTQDIHKTLEQKIANFYSRKLPVTGGKTVRKWLEGLSFENQHAYGLRVLKAALKGAL